MLPLSLQNSLLLLQCSHSSYNAPTPPSILSLPLQSFVQSPDEELAKRGFSMYSPEDREQDVEAGRDRERERQTGGQLVDALAREIELRQQRQSAPPFLLQSIEDNKRRSRALGNPVANGRQSETNPNFIY
ncbi:uncharacterized protein LOC135076360 isoform X1 [Ostrinia nubilalis]|uniref:uncharacterized protein LOC135076360 isoform X1 n=1 Tax=Ostrinia nubilalis TaxID=29057 RepID=UPI0030826ACD